MQQATNPLAIITGGTSGIGYELAKVFAVNGYDVAISGSSERVYESAAELKALGVEAYAHRADAATYEGVQDFWDFIVSLNRPVDAAALNVGIAIGGGFAELALEDHLRIISINVSGLVHIAHRVTKHMLEQGRGKILVVSSVSATQATPYETVYGPSKAFGFSFAEGLREELRGSHSTSPWSDRYRVPPQWRHGQLADRPCYEE